MTAPALKYASARLPLPAEMNLSATSSQRPELQPDLSCSSKALSAASQAASLLVSTGGGGAASPGAGGGVAVTVSSLGPPAGEAGVVGPLAAGAPPQAAI